MAQVQVNYTTEEEVMFYDTDCGGVVHNLAYLRMIEACRTKLAIQLGMNLMEMAENQLYPVVVRTETDYKSPGAFGDTLVIHGKISEIERVRFWFSFEVRRKSDDALLIKAKQSLALVQMPAAKPVRIPKEWRESWGAALAEQS